LVICFSTNSAIALSSTFVNSSLVISPATNLALASTNSFGLKNDPT